MILHPHPTDKVDALPVSAYWSPYLPYSVRLKSVQQYPHSLPLQTSSQSVNSVPSDMSGSPHLRGLERPQSTDDLNTKVRKPYTITKQRERWAEEEHLKFLEALRLYGRAWRRIEEHIGTKTAVQIRSHAQKFFSKLERDASQNGGVAQSTLPDIDIPPPRPKRKPSHPYPRKAGATSTTSGSPAEREDEREEGSGRSLPRVVSAPPTHIDCAIAASLAAEELSMGGGLCQSSGNAGFSPYSGRMQTGTGNLRSNLAGRVAPRGGLPLCSSGMTSPSQPPSMAGGGGGGSPNSVKLFGQTLVVPTAHRAAALLPGVLPSGLVRASSSGDIGTAFRTGDSAFVPRGASVEHGESGGESVRRERDRGERGAGSSAPSQSERSILESGLSVEGNSEGMKEEGVSGSPFCGGNWRNPLASPSVAMTRVSQQLEHHRGYFPFEAPLGLPPRGPVDHYDYSSSHGSFAVAAATAQMMASAAAAAMGGPHLHLNPGLAAMTVPPSLGREDIPSHMSTPMYGPMEYTSASMMHSSYFPPGSFPLPPPRHHPAFLAAYGPHGGPSPGPPFGIWGAPGGPDPAAMAAAAAASMWSSRGNMGEIGLPPPGEGEEGSAAAAVAAATVAAASAWWALQGAVPPGMQGGILSVTAATSQAVPVDDGRHARAERVGKGGEGEEIGGALNGREMGEEGEEVGGGMGAEVRNAEVSKPADLGTSADAQEESSAAVAPVGESEAVSPKMAAKSSGMRRAERASRLKELKMRRTPGNLPSTCRQNSVLATTCTDSSPSAAGVAASTSIAASFSHVGVNSNHNCEGSSTPEKGSVPFTASSPVANTPASSAAEVEPTEGFDVTVKGEPARALLSMGKCNQKGTNDEGNKVEKVKDRRSSSSDGTDLAEGGASPSLVEGEAPRKRPRGRSVSGSNSPLGNGIRDEVDEKHKVGVVQSSSGSDGSGGEGDGDGDGDMALNVEGVGGRGGDTSGGGPSSNSSGCGNLDGKRRAGSSDGGSTDGKRRAGSSDGGSSDGDGGEGPKEKSEEGEAAGEGEQGQGGTGAGSPLGGEQAGTLLPAAEKGDHRESERHSGRHGKHSVTEGGGGDARKEVSSEGRKAFHALFARDMLPRDFSPLSWNGGNKGSSTLLRATPQEPSQGGGVPGVHHHFHYHYHSGSLKSGNSSTAVAASGVGEAAAALTAIDSSNDPTCQSSAAASPSHHTSCPASEGEEKLTLPNLSKPQEEENGNEGELNVKVEGSGEGEREESRSPTLPQMTVASNAGNQCGHPVGRDKAIGLSPFDQSTAVPQTSPWRTAGGCIGDLGAEAHRQRLSMLRTVGQSSTGGESPENGPRSPPGNARFGGGGSGGGGFQPYTRSVSGSMNCSPGCERKRRLVSPTQLLENAADAEPIMPLKKRPCPPVCSS